MAKVKRFRDRRKTNNLPVSVADGQSQGRPCSSQHSGIPGDTHGIVLPTLTQKVGQDVATEDSMIDPALTDCPPQSSRYQIQVPGVEKVMARVEAGAESCLSWPPALTASLQQPSVYITYQPVFRPFLDPNVGLSIAGHPSIPTAPASSPRYINPTPSQPTSIELAGYAGLEEVPILQAIMAHPDTNRILTFFFRYNDTNCPAGVLLIDPLRGRGKLAEEDRNCHCNDGHEAWLYTRERGDVKWKRDYMAERGMMRHVIYLSRCEEGWRWEQQLGDMLDCRKALNLWIKVKA